MGKIPQSPKSSDTSLLVISLHIRSEKIKDLWELDLLGIKDPAESKRVEDLNQETLDLFNQTVKRESDGRYIVSLPWIGNHPPLPTNRELAEKRLKSTFNNLKLSGNLEAYQKVLKEEIIENITDENACDGHFLPHRAVIRQSSTTKIRPAFDGSANEKHSFSLNSCLATGSNLMELIPSILHRFRKGKIGLSADIRKAFLQISQNEKERNVLKFLWWKDGDSTKLQVYRHCRVVFGLKASPFL